MPRVELDNVVRRFGQVTAVDKVNIHMPDGAFVTLLGPSGCGKTTTLRMVAGLEQNDEGTIRIGDRVVSDAQAGIFLPPDRRDLGMVFQSYAIWPHMTVFENVAYPLRARKVAESDVTRRVREALELVEMSGFEDRPAPALSGGQQQRVAIARSLVSRPHVLLMDEPLSNLDAKLREQMRVDLRRLQQRLGITTVYVTHDQREAMELSDQVVVMHAGRVLQTGTPWDIYHQPASRRVAAFLGSPNLLAANVTDVAESTEGPQVGVAGEGWCGRCLAGAGTRVGDKVLVIVRPESLQCVTEAALQKDDVAWRGVIDSTTYQGAAYTVRVNIPGATVQAEVAADLRPRVGDHIVLRSTAREMWAVQAETLQ